MEFAFGRLSLLEKEQGSLFRSESPAREEWLRQVFSEPLQFEHRGSIMHYVPVEIDDADFPFIVGRVGKTAPIIENEPPEAGLVETTREQWKAGLLFIDPRAHNDGQKFAFQDGRVGRAGTVFASLSEMISNRYPDDYVIESGLVTREESFWAFLEENKGRVTNIAFELFAPNMFPEDGDYDREMKDMKEKEKIRKVKIQLENSDGLDLETERVKHLADYAMRGTGGLKAKAPGVPTYSLKKNTETMKIENTDTSMLDSVIRIGKRLFNHE